MFFVDILSEILALGGTSFVVGFIIGLFIRALSKVIALIPVSYTHLTLPTIYSV